jgi:hypothetical protein
MYSKVLGVVVLSSVVGVVLGAAGVPHAGAAEQLAAMAPPVKAAEPVEALSGSSQPPAPMVSLPAERAAAARRQAAVKQTTDDPTLALLLMLQKLGPLPYGQR